MGDASIIVRQVLDRGCVRLVDTTGNDRRIVDAARTSYGDGTSKFRSDRGLIRYLMRHRHTTPFEFCDVTFFVKAPMDVWRQWIRHRTASVNEYSTRYSEALEDTHTTQPWQWRLQSSSNKQGSEGFVERDRGVRLSSTEARLHEVSRGVYSERRRAGVAREQARKDLPLSTYTQAYWKIDLHNLLHFLALRMAPDAQTEIRAYANAIASIVEEWVPITWEAFIDYRLEAVTLSSVEVEAIRMGYAEHLTKREAAELAPKLKRLGIELKPPSPEPGE